MIQANYSGGAKCIVARLTKILFGPSPPGPCTAHKNRYCLWLR